MNIRIVDGPGNGQLYTFPNQLRVLAGRDLRCNLCLRDDKCSRQHFEIYADGDSLWARDLSSANGTLLNDAPLDASILMDGDVIKAGRTTMLMLDTGTQRDPHKAPPKLTVNDSPSHVILSLPQTDANLLALHAGAQPIVDLERENTVLREVCEVCQVIATGEDDRSIIDTLVQRVQDLLKADGVCYIESTGDDDDWEVRSSASSEEHWRKVTISQSIIQLALRQNASILTTDPSNDERFDPGKSIVLQRITSAICSPLMIDDEPFGVLFIVRRGPGDTFSELELRIAATMANVLALYLRKSRLETEARQKNRLAVIGEVVAGLAHCAKNILMGLDFSLANVKSNAEVEEADTTLQSINVLEAQKQRLSNLVQDMLNYAKERVPERTSTDLAKVFGEAITPYTYHFNADNIRLELDIAPDLVPIQADENALLRVFLNLITNAIDALDGADEASEKQIHVSMKPELHANQVRMTFRDNGTGIPESDQARIFDVLYSTKGSKGSGIGLAVVKKIIVEHGGNIDVTSTPGSGTTFTLCLPIAYPTGAPTPSAT